MFGPPWPWNVTMSKDQWRRLQYPKPANMHILLEKRNLAESSRYPKARPLWRGSINFGPIFYNLLSLVDTQKESNAFTKIHIIKLLCQNPLNFVSDDNRYFHNPVTKNNKGDKRQPCYTRVLYFKGYLLLFTHQELCISCLYILFFFKLFTILFLKKKSRTLSHIIVLGHMVLALIFWD